MEILIQLGIFATLLLVGLFFGRASEQRHFADLARREAELRDILVFNEDYFFYFILPPIVFNSGFNMRRKKFFANLGYVSVFGFIGTLIAFVSFTLFTVIAFQLFEFEYYDPVTE